MSHRWIEICFIMSSHYQNLHTPIIRSNYPFKSTTWCVHKRVTIWLWYIDQYGSKDRWELPLLQLISFLYLLWSAHSLNVALWHYSVKFVKGAWRRGPHRDCTNHIKILHQWYNVPLANLRVLQYISVVQLTFMIKWDSSRCSCSSNTLEHTQKKKVWDPRQLLSAGRP